MLEYLCELEIYHIKRGLYFHYYKYEMPYFSTTPNSVLEITSYLESAPGEVLTSNKFTTLGYLTVSDRCQCHWGKKAVRLKAILSAIITHVYYKLRWFLDFSLCGDSNLVKTPPFQLMVEMHSSSIVLVS